MDEDKEILNFIQDLKCFEKIKMKIASIQKSFYSLKKIFINVEILKYFLTVNKGKLVEDDKTEEFLNGFYDHASENMKLIKEDIRKISVQYKSISKYLALKNIIRINLSIS